MQKVDTIKQPNITVIKSRDLISWLSNNIISVQLWLSFMILPVFIAIIIVSIFTHSDMFEILRMLAGCWFIIAAFGVVMAIAWWDELHPIWEPDKNVNIVESFKRWIRGNKNAKL